MKVLREDTIVSRDGLRKTLIQIIELWNPEELKNKPFYDMSKPRYGLHVNSKPGYKTESWGDILEKFYCEIEEAKKTAEEKAKEAEIKRKEHDAWVFEKFGGYD